MVSNCREHDEISFYITRDDGISWEPVSFVPEHSQYDHYYITTSTFACSPDNCDHLYVMATGNTLDDPYNYKPSLLASHDRGVTWTQKDTEIFYDQETGGGTLYDLIVSPDESKLFLILSRSAGCSGPYYSLYLSIDGGLTFNAPVDLSYNYTPVKLIFTCDPNRVYLLSSSLYRSSDGGLTWEPKPIDSSFFADCVADIENPDTLYSLQTSRTKGNRWCISHDAGETWQALDHNLWEYTGSFDHCELISTTADPSTLYIYNNHSSSYACAKLLRTRDNGQSWYPMTEGFPSDPVDKELVPDPRKTNRPWLHQGKYLYHWEPENQAPFIPLAGWKPAAIRKTVGGPATLWARVVDADGLRDIRSVDLMYSGMNTGIQLFDDGQHDDLNPQDGFWGVTFDIPPDSVSEGRYLFEIQAVDYAGNTSSVWPYLTVGNIWQWENEQTGSSGSSPLQIDTWNDASVSSGSGEDPWFHYSPDQSPAISLAGWTYTPKNSWVVMTVNYAALVLDPQDQTLISAVEFYSQGYPTGLVLNSSSYYHAEELCYGDIPGFFSYGLRISDAVSPGSYLMELSAVNENGFRSALWPYLTVY